MVDADVEKMLKKFGLTGMIAAIVMIVFGVLVIAMPSLIAWIIGLYLIIHGVIELLGHLDTNKCTESKPAKKVRKPKPEPEEDNEEEPEED